MLKVQWPARTERLIPYAANALVVTIAQGTTTLSQKIARPATTAAFTGLAYGAYSVAIQAFPDAAATGVVQATGNGSMTVTEDVPGSIDVGLGSTVAALSVTPATVSTSTGATTTLTASATDASGAIVLLSAGGGTEPLTWTSDAPAIAKVTGSTNTATLTGVAVGTANVTASLKVTDAGTVKMATVPVTVSSQTVLPIAPSDARTIATNGVTSSLVSGLKDGRVSGGRPGLPPTVTTYRWQALFPLSGIPAGATIQSATITTSLSAYSALPFTHACSAYKSTSGTLTTAALTGTTALSAPSTAVGAKSIDATAAVKAYYAAGAAYAGMAISESAATVSTATWTQPTLTVTYTVP